MHASWKLALPSSIVVAECDPSEPYKSYILGLWLYLPIEVCMFIFQYTGIVSNMAMD